jgi:hypothetical protein
MQCTEYTVSVGRSLGAETMRMGCSAQRLDSAAREEWQSVRSEVFTAVTMKNGVFWDVTPCGLCKNRRFGGT